MFSAVALALTLAAPAVSPAVASGRGPTVLAEGLAAPLSVAIGTGKSVFAAQGGTNQLTRIDKYGARSTVATLAAGELTGVSFARNSTYHIESTFAGAPSSHLIRTTADGTRTVVSDDFWAHEIATNPDGNRTYGVTGLDQTCKDAVDAALAAIPAPGPTWWPTPASWSPTPTRAPCRGTPPTSPTPRRTPC